MAESGDVRSGQTAGMFCEAGSCIRQLNDRMRQSASQKCESSWDVVRYFDLPVVVSQPSAISIGDSQAHRRRFWPRMNAVAADAMSQDCVA